MSKVPAGRVAEVARLALRLGFTAFGGPAAHIAMLHDEVVLRRKWLSEQEFLDLLGITNLVPGPNSTEMVIHVGRVRAGRAGLIAAGVCFILPAAAIVLALAWAYVEFGDRPTGDWLLYGIKPVVIAIVAQALVKLARTAVKGWLLGLVAASCLLLFLTGVDELLLLALAALAGFLAAWLPLARSTLPAGLVAGDLLRPAVEESSRGLPEIVGRLWHGGLAGWAGIGGALTAVAGVSLPQLFWVFLKAGAFLYGSGYVLLAFLRDDLVLKLGWLTDAQLLDAIAIGQLTPGPVFTTATFVGYLLAGGPGALLATLGIFLPAFVFVAATGPLLERMRRSEMAGAVLDAVNAAALGLMAAVLLQLGRDALVDPLTVGTAIAAAALLGLGRVNSAWLILGGGLLGYLARSAGWI